MHIQVTSKQITLSDSMKEYIESSIKSFSKFKLDVLSAVGIVSKEGKNIKFEITLNVAKKGTVVAKDSSDDFYKSVDSVVEKIEAQLNHLHEKKSQIHRDKPVYEEEVFEDEEAS